MGPITVRWYGIMIAAGFLLATIFAARMAEKRGLSAEELLNLCLVCFVGGVVGARLYFVFLNLPHYGAHPEEIYATWLGGLSIHGGLVGGFLSGAIYAQWKKLPKRVYADVIGSVLPLAQGIGRWGNFFNSEAFGLPAPADFPIVVKIPPGCRPEAYKQIEFFQPTFLYESVWNLLLFIVLYFFLSDRLRKYPGVCFLTYLAAYSVGRLLIEPIRTDSIMYGAMPVPIIASLVSLVVSAIMIVIFVMRKKRTD